MGAAVTVRTRDGREFAAEALEAKGWPTKPLTRNELVAKFRDCAGVALAGTQVDESLDLIEGLEALPDIHVLMNVIGSSKHLCVEKASSMMGPRRGIDIERRRISDEAREAGGRPQGPLLPMR